MLASKLLAAIPPPPAPRADAIQAFIAAHPERFAERRMMTVDTLSFASASDPVSAGLTWDDLERRLQTAKIPHVRDSHAVPAWDVQPKLMAALDAASADGLVALHDGDQVTVYRRTGLDPSPLLGEVAAIEARTELQKQARDRQVEELVRGLRRTHKVQTRAAG